MIKVDIIIQEIAVSETQFSEFRTWQAYFIKENTLTVPRL